MPDMTTETVGCNGYNCIFYTKHIDRVTWDDAYNKGYRKPNYPVPALIGPYGSFITMLWLHHHSSRRKRAKVNKLWLALCFDKNGHYTG